MKPWIHASLRGAMGPHGKTLGPKHLFKEFLPRASMLRASMPAQCTRPIDTLSGTGWNLGGP